MTLLKTKTGNPWLAPHEARPYARVRLFCFPFAGGNASAYWGWAEGFPRDVEVCPVQLPGRGTRYTEPPFETMRDLVRATATGIENCLDRAFAFYGHSMGALLAFELAHELRARGRRGPMALFAGAHQAPMNPYRFGIAHRTDAEVFAFVKRLSDQPDLLDEHPELLNLVLPTLRADLAVCDSYVYTRRLRLDCGLTVIGGVDDVLPYDELARWQSETTGPFDIEMLPGGHFFLNTSREALLRCLARRLSVHQAASAAG